MLVSDKFQGEPFTVRRPGVVESAAGAVPCGAIGYLPYLLALQVVDHEAAAVLDESKLLPVGRELRMGTFYGVGGEQRLFLYQGCVGEVRVFLPDYLCQVDLQVPVALAVVSQSPVVRSKREMTLPRCRMGDLLGGGVLCGSDEYFTPHGESYLLAVGRYSGGSGAVRIFEVGYLRLVVAYDVHAGFPGSGTYLLGVDLPVVSVAQDAVAAYRKEAYGMRLEGGDRFHGLRLREREGIYVERSAVALAQEVEGFSVRSQYGVPVFACTVGEVGVASCLLVVHPHVPSDGGGMVFSPFVLAAFAVLIEETFARLVEADGFGGRA